LPKLADGCTWSLLADTVAIPADAVPNDVGSVVSNAKRVASVLTKVLALPAELTVPKVKDGVPPLLPVNTGLPFTINPPNVPVDEPALNKAELLITRLLDMEVENPPELMMIFAEGFHVPDPVGILA